MKDQIKEAMKNVLRAIRLQKNRRQEFRIAPESHIEAKIQKCDQLAQVVDISRSGASLSIRSAEFLIGDEVQISFHAANGHVVICKARILAQSIYYPHGIEDLDQAFYRFSVQFEQKVDVRPLIAEEKIVQPLVTRKDGSDLMSAG